MDEPALRGMFGESLQRHGEKERLYRLLQRSSLRGVFSTVGSVRWRALLLIILLAALYSDAPGPDSQEKVD